MGLAAQLFKFFVVFFAVFIIDGIRGRFLSGS
jgi:hypothetical protein